MPDHTSTTPTTTSNRRPAPAVGLTQLLSSSWATDGTKGFFVEAGTVSQAMSLYATRWWLDTASSTGLGRPVGIDPAATAGWVTEIAAGRQTPAGDTGGLPELERIDDAVGILQAIGRPVDAAAVTAALNGLLDGDSYRPDPDATPDLGDTSVAVAILHRLGSSPPPQVTKALADQLPRALSDQRTADLVAFTVPELSTISQQTAVRSAPSLTAELQWIRSQLAELPPLARMSVVSSMTPMLGWLKLPKWSPAEVCSGLPVSPTGVSSSTDAQVDPQLTFEAVAAGCLATARLPPWTPSGWPDADAVDASLPASVDGLRVARSLGESQYMEPLRRQLAEVWAPALGAQPTAPVAAATDQLAAQLSVPLPVQPSAEQITNALTAAPSSAVLTELVLVAVAHPTGLRGSSRAAVSGQPSPTAARPGAVVSTPADTAPITTAIIDELRFRLTADPTDHTAALTLLHGLSAGGTSLYALSPSGPPSVAATVFGSWIAGRPLPAVELRAAGTCSATYVCTGDDPGAMTPPLQTAAATTVLTDPVSDVFPFAF